ncbi:amino acid dehydrogenase [Janthinobacterium lividum]|uniref:D-amino acid dehydrogenase n=1 Tax=Janthinobacterium lividum TaxID=29581 RepID=UPI000538595B|nr:D-amino acid dehydrogenase [Janthinobacterium lividum]KHA78980.1 amino acid dehydrogenase [Janthinobacterium lividum]QKY02133.1 D-amino acid dehydrogenase [Janthinobacterium lividum]
MSRVAVLGAGITGVTTAYALAKRGVDVTLIERHRYAAMETSYANGGQLSASHAEVWNHKATILNALKWMARRDAPLLLHPWPSWHKLSWFAEFLAAMPAYERNTIATARMAIAAREHLFTWAKEENIAFDHRRAGILHVYRERAGFERAAEVSRLLAQGGLERRAVTRQEMRAIEPTLQGDFYGGYYTDSDSTGDIHKFTSGLADACVRLGVACRYSAQVTALAREHGKVRISVGDGAGEDSTLFDAVVICAGTASRALAASLGDHVNVYPVKGYSITVQLDELASRAAAPKVSLLDDATKLVSSRLGEDRLRVAGTAEFNGINHDIRADRIRPLLQWVEQCFPGINTRKVIPWAGLRPMLPDMLPKVGPGKAPGVYYNTGHGHLGWTLAAATAEMVAQQVAAVARD